MSAAGTTTGSDTTTSSGNTSSGAPSTSSTEDAGTIASFTNEVLTITLKDGSSVSGKVTNQTSIECISTTAAPSTSTSQSDNESSDDNGSGDDQAQGDRNQQAQQQGDNQDQQQSTGQDDNGQDDDMTTSASISSEPPCDTTALTPGTVVREAELRVGPGGSEFESIELVR